MARKGACKSGGTAARLRERNGAQAARMKKLGIVRTTQKCPICYRIVGIGSAFDRHLATGCR